MSLQPLPSKPKILHIEGHTTIRDVYHQLLEQSTDFELDTASNGVEGQEKAQTWQPDLILIGLRMPETDGFETIEAIRNHPATAHIPIIVLSAWASANHKEHAFAAGANEHLTLPVDTERLVRRINHYLK